MTAAWKCRYANVMMRECMILNNTPEFRKQVTEELRANQAEVARAALADRDAAAAAAKGKK